MARDIHLNALKAGINRLRTKGGADPSSLYDLVNGYIDVSGNAVSRPGTTRDAVLPAGTSGFCAFNGGFTVFSHQPTPIDDARYHCEVLAHPDDPDQPIKAIHFAAPFMGALYVAAEFADGTVAHYWLQAAEAWAAQTVYFEGGAVRPTTANGLVYTASTTNRPPVWQAQTTYAVGDVVQPPEYNGYQYTLVEADGDNPASGASEPAWIAAEGALVTEDVDNTPAPTPNPTPTPGSTIPDRYRNLIGLNQTTLERAQ